MCMTAIVLNTVAKLWHKLVSDEQNTEHSG